MKKKILIVLLVIVIAFAALVMLGSSEDEEETADSSASAEDADASESSEEETVLDEITFESLSVVDNDECAITITGIDPDNTWGYTLNAELENKNSELTYMFAIEYATINGVESDPLFATSVAAEKKSVEEITFYDDDTLTDNGVGEFTDICLSFHVYDEDDWTADYVAEVTVHVYPYGEDNASVFVRESQDTDTVIYEDDNVSLTILSCGEDDLWGYAVEVYLVNSTEKSAMFSLDDASVNGYMCDPFWASDVPAGSSAFSTIYFYESDLEEIGITDPENEIEEIEFVLDVYDSEDYAEDYVEETFVFNP